MKKEFRLSYQLGALALSCIISGAALAQQHRHRSVPPPSPPATAEQAKIVLNRASVAELRALVGVGPALAERILRYRERHGNFRKLEELMRVKGVGPRLFKRNRSRLQLD